MLRTDTHLYLICTLPEIVGLFFRPRPRQADEKQPQMLDAAHGERIGALAVVQRLHRPGVEPQVSCLLIAGKERRRSPVPTVRADVPQGSRRRVAVACSRRKRAIAQRNAAERANNGFCTNVDASCGSSVRVAALAGAGPQTSGCRRACPAGCDRPTLTTLLCHSERSEESFSLANQRPLADYASQGGERQTKCSQESVYVYFYTDSSSIFRSPQNDELLLNCAL